MSDDLVSIATYRTRMEADVAAGLLAEAGIPCLIQGGESTGVVPMTGGVALLVRSTQVPHAIRVLGYPRSEEGA